LQKPVFVDIAHVEAMADRSHVIVDGDRLGFDHDALGVPVLGQLIGGQALVLVTVVIMEQERRAVAVFLETDLAVAVLIGIFERRRRGLRKCG